MLSQPVESFGKQNFFETKEHFENCTKQNLFGNIYFGGLLILNYDLMCGSDLNVLHLLSYMVVKHLCTF